MPPRSALDRFKPRELRRRVVLPARVRDGSEWSTACILNISSRGMLLHSKSAAPRGSRVELTHGPYVITARVVWRSGAKLGVATEDPLPVIDLAARAPVPAPPPMADGQSDQRRRHQRTHEQSRQRLRAIEFACVVTIGASLAAAAFGMVEQAFAAPLELVQSALGG